MNNLKSSLFKSICSSPTHPVIWQGLSLMPALSLPFLRSPPSSCTDPLWVPHLQPKGKRLGSQNGSTEPGSQPGLGEQERLMRLSRNRFSRRERHPRPHGMWRGEKPAREKPGSKGCKESICSQYEWIRGEKGKENKAGRR